MPKAQTQRESLSADQSSQDFEQNLGRVGLSLFFALAEEWSLSQAEQLTLLGLGSRTTLKNYRERVAQGENVKLPVDTLERLSLIAGIRKAVELLYPETRWNDFMRAANSVFGGVSVLTWMLGGKVGHLYDVRRYLDAQRGAHFA